MSSQTRQPNLKILRQIGGWIDTQYVSPDNYWIRTYKIIKNTEAETENEAESEAKLKLELNSETLLPTQIHAELRNCYMPRLIYEASRILITARVNI